jgi:hypothetical protein
VRQVVDAHRRKKRITARSPNSQNSCNIRDPRGQNHLCILRAKSLYKSLLHTTTSAPHSSIHLLCPHPIFYANKAPLQRKSSFVACSNTRPRSISQQLPPLLLLWRALHLSRPTVSLGRDTCNRLGVLSLYHKHTLAKPLPLTPTPGETTHHAPSDTRSTPPPTRGSACSAPVQRRTGSPQTAPRCPPGPGPCIQRPSSPRPGATGRGDRVRQRQCSRLIGTVSSRGHASKGGVYLRTGFLLLVGQLGPVADLHAVAQGHPQVGLLLRRHRLPALLDVGEGWVGDGVGGSALRRSGQGSRGAAEHGLSQHCGRWMERETGC